MKKILMVLALLALFVAAQAQIAATGAGATFPAPIYAKWADEYQKATGKKINYQGIGSSGGQRQIRAKTVDFAGSDDPLTIDVLQADGLVQFPMVLGGVVAVYNLTGFNADLRLDGQTLADIFQGKITNWSDRRIAALNPGVRLPSQYITVVRRSDGSGTTFIFSNYLSKVSEDWKANIGEGKALQWPVGVGGRGNAGVAGFVRQINGAIGYVEYAFAKREGLSIFSLKNADGNFVQPGPESVAAAAANAKWDPAQGYYLVLTQQAGANSWPLAAATFILMRKTADNPEGSKAALDFMMWAYKNGAGMADELGYVPIPMNVVSMIEETWRQELRDAAGNPIWK